MIVLHSKLNPGTKYIYEDEAQLTKGLANTYKHWQAELANTTNSRFAHACQEELADLEDLAQQAGWESIKDVM